MHLVRLDGDDLHIHLSGTCSGCPGVSLTGDHMLLPALRSGSPKLRLFITTGTVVPDGAEKL